MPKESDFNEDQIHLLNRLPESADRLSREFDISRDALRQRIKRINEKFEDDVIQYNNGTWHWDGGDDIHRLTSRNKGSITREANKALTKLERDDKNALAGLADPNLPPLFPGGSEDIVVHRSDSHIGQLIYDEFNRTEFDVEVSLRRERVINETLEGVSKYVSKYKDVGTLYYLLGGDTVTNENIYENQPYEIEITLDKQIDLAADLFLNNLRKLAPLYPKIVVVMQGGNHGELRANGQSKKANADDIAYARLTRLIKENQLYGEMTNIRVIRNDSSNFTNFGMRVDPDTKKPKWRAHMRHGQDSLYHIGTSSAMKRWLAWLRKFDFNIAYRGHYHSLRLEYVADAPVIMGGSVCPDGEYEDSLGIAQSTAGAMIHGVNDETPLSWVRPITFDSPNVNDIVSVI